jgi:hypothetical protein
LTRGKDYAENILLVIDKKYPANKNDFPLRKVCNIPDLKKNITTPDRTMVCLPRVTPSSKNTPMNKNKQPETENFIFGYR